MSYTSETNDSSIYCPDIRAFSSRTAQNRLYFYKGPVGTITVSGYYSAG